MHKPIYADRTDLFLGPQRVSRVGGLPAHDVPIRRIALCRTRRAAASVDEDGTLRVWNLSDLRSPQEPIEAGQLEFRNADLIAVCRHDDRIEAAVLTGGTLYFYGGFYSNSSFRRHETVPLVGLPSVIGRIVRLEYHPGFASNITWMLMCADESGNELPVCRYTSTSDWRLPPAEVLHGLYRPREAAVPA